LADFHLRDAGQRDVGLLAGMLIEAYAFYGQGAPASAATLSERLRRFLGAQPGYEALLAEVAGQCVGFAIYAPVFWTSDCELSLFLKEIYITDSARRSGIGRAMMAELAAIAEVRGWTRVVWTVDRHNSPALGFYRTLPGARQIDKFVYIQSGADLSRFAAEARAIET
jgi:GNAT superfamily N-acetyltransferase